MNTTIDHNLKRAHGGRPREYDRKRFSHYKVYGTFDASTLPVAGLGRRPVYKIKDQLYTSFCTAFATATGREYQEKVELSPEYQAALIGALMGAPITNGADAKIALQAGVASGCLEQKDAPYSLADHDDHFLAELKNWPQDLLPKARVHQAESYFDALDGPSSQDLFDRARVSLAKAKIDNGVLICTSAWYTSWNMYLNPGASGFGGVKGCAGPALGAYAFHDWIIIDWRQNPQTGEEEMVAQNSYGEGYGDGGLFYLDRATFNTVFAVRGSGASIYRDIDPTAIKSLQLQNQSIGQIFFELFLRCGVPLKNALQVIKQVFKITPNQ